MEILVKHENGYRFTATCKGFTVTTGRGNDGNTEKDGMWPAQLFSASIGMCIGGYIVEYCEHQGIDLKDLTIELSRRSEKCPSNPVLPGVELTRTTRINVKINVGTKLPEQQLAAILEAAESCHITASIREGMEVVCSLTEATNE
ncbi:MAG: OsmC family protein [Sedimentisphaerales bacterium]|nr:OsmC family protein [Sedimentisphaerales bacterium]